MSRRAGNAALNTQGGVVDTKAESNAFFGLEIDEGGELKELDEKDGDDPDLQTSENEEGKENGEGDDETPKVNKAPVVEEVKDVMFALTQMRQGYRVSRPAWQGASMELQNPDAGSKNTLPYFMATTVSGAKYPQTLSSDDVLAKDWLVVEE